ncbi:hypothetical protein ACFSHT_40825 [Paraburkholderia silviterrae]|uniref:Uncharacterized protein n=1 Tax=Paraburkholderia silviterrae TaxID=2528715 RepID=A0A4R5LY41_9BURK|nr:hypothetical protein [Paraburkholderia silviterrae]TDG17160.1 hypothetical protein EYW47_38840 [Paraburkholderia silviterrae]
MSKLHFGPGTEADFFASGKRVARGADRGEALVETRALTFEDPADAVQLLTEARIGVFRAIEAHSVRSR